MALVLARVTFTEATRQRYFNFLLLIAVAFLGSSLFLQQFNFGSSELKFIYDLGTGTLLFFGTILAILLTTQMVFSEFDNRTALTVLARPVSRTTFLLGKFVGIWGLLGCFVGILILLLLSILQIRFFFLSQEDPALLERAVDLRTGELLVFGFIQWLRLGVISSLALFFSTFASSALFAMVISFFGVIISQLQYIALESLSADQSFFYRAFVYLISVLFPNFQLFNLGDVLVFPLDEPMEVGSVLRIIGYASVYLLLYQILSVFLFREKEI